MTLLELFLEYGNPAETYSDEVVARFYTDVDDGAFFGEALAELAEEQRKRLGRLIHDTSSRSLSHQMIGKIVTDQLREYVRLYLQKKHDELADDIRAHLVAQHAYANDEIKVDAALDVGDATGCQP